jgi:metallo-beta-lactamase class B
LLASLSVAALSMPHAAAQRPQSRGAFKIFDNLYYVGIDTVSAYLVTTSAGLILIDTTFADSADMVLENIRRLGFDPANVEYVFVSHGHGDHSAGAPRVKEVTGARIGMTAADWAMTKIQRDNGDLVMTDGQSVTLGDTTFRFYVTPGHTPGVLSMEFPVRDGSRTHKAFMFGGMGLNFSGVDRTEMYLDSVRRVQKMEGVEVNVTNHEGAGQIFARADRLAKRRAGDPHPFVDPQGFTEWLQQLETNGVAKLEKERAAAGANR